MTDKTFIPDDQLKAMVDYINNHTEKKDGLGGGSDVYFRQALKNLSEADGDLSAKTDFQTNDEIHAHQKLEFYGITCGIPIAYDYMRIREKKLISRKRLSRVEMVEALKRRNEEMREQEELFQQTKLSQG